MVLNVEQSIATIKYLW